MAEPGSHTKKSSEDQRKNLLQMYVLLLESTQWQKKKKSLGKSQGSIFLSLTLGDDDIIKVSLPLQLFFFFNFTSKIKKETARNHTQANGLFRSMKNSSMARSPQCAQLGSQAPPLATFKSSPSCAAKNIFDHGVKTGSAHTQRHHLLIPGSDGRFSYLKTQG